MEYSMPSFSGNIKFRAIMLTPERAEQLLANNHPRNRAMKVGRITQMIADIREGNWRLTPEPIVVSDQGILLDGQNRCTACSQSGITIPVFFCTGVPEEVVVAMDCGASRNVADAAKILGKDIKQIAGVAAVARRMYSGLDSSRSKSAGLSIQETLSWIEVHKMAIQFAWACLPLNKHGITQAGVRAVLARAYYRRPVDETRARCVEFGEVLLSGLPKNSKQDSAAIRLRNWLQDHFSQGRRARSVKVRTDAVTVTAKTEAALDHFLRYEPIESLKETSNELFYLPGEKGEIKKIQLMEETA